MTSISGDVVVASANPGKIAELARLLRNLPVTLRLQAEYRVVPAEETGLTFVENALLKARAAAAQSGRPAIADDSGLAVDALGGAPGIRSARFAADAGRLAAGADVDAANRRQLLDALQGVDDGNRGAHFYCVLVLLRHAEDPAPLIAQGCWHGGILRAERGSGGFGYDPLFEVPGYGLTAAELDPAEKNAISHRGQAVRELLRLLDAA